MSTNLNTNNSSQTLFRFAAMRNPELSDPKNLDRRFIFRDSTIANTSVFDTNLPVEKTLQAISRKINQPNSGITLGILTESDIKDIDSGKIYELAVWVARNKTTATKAEFDQKINDYKASNPTLIHLPDPTDVWDNLVYQVVTQKDFYAKELIMQYLHLEHILNVYDGSEESFEDMKKAKVVLPKELFKVSQADFNATGSSTLQRTMFDDKAMKFAEATINLKENQDLIDALSKLEKSYKKQHEAAYKEAYDEYQQTVKPLLKTVQKDSAEAERKKQILENRINYLTQLSVADPEKFYANSEMDMELHRIKDEIMQITTPDVEIPEFEFIFETPEIDIAEIGRTLTVSNQKTLLKILGASTLTDALSDISTFDELNQNITQSNQTLQQTVLNNTVLNQQVSANVGGVIIPVSNNSVTSNYIPFSIKTYARSSTEWSLLLALSSNLDIVSANYKITLNNVDISSTSVSSMGGGSCLLFDIPRILVSQTSLVEQFILQGEVKLSDGNTYKLNVTLLQDLNDLDRMTKQYHFRGADGCFPVDPPKPENPETPETPTNNPTETSSFIPSGFGMKNIGVADYLKVEQSTYCYVEGDVAHIENIMAREYKERSTRRLKRSESQTTKSTESEKEKLTDTTSTERHEMQSEISKILQESKDFAAQAGFTASWGSEKGTGRYGLSANASYATHNSKEESNRQAVTEAKDITARALDRIVTKVKEERIDKVLEEYEENNKHGFDNTKGSNHVVGVYRWVDKVVKNQIYNYGKRMMFEFMIPEPAKLHNLGVKMIDASEKLLKPVDPRESSTHKLDNFSSLNDDTKLKFWLSKYNVEIDEFPMPTFNINKSFHERDSSHAGHDDGKVQVANGSGEVEIPEGYIANQVTYTFNTYPHGFNGSHQAFITIAGRPIPWIESIHQTQKDGTIGNLNVRNKLAYSFATGESPIIEGSLDILCNLTLEAKNAWLQSTFNKIIEAYELELEKYNQALAEAKALGVQIKGSNPGFYRKIENTVLRKNCISYMIDQNPAAALTFGKNKYHNNGYTSGQETFLNTDIKVDSTLDQYAAFVKFMEQAFEWDIMSYYFYPYYWGNREKWADMYQFDDNDPTFRAFMQSGMARVIVTVRPGFEEAVRHFLATGQIWNGGEVPVIDDPLFLSIVDEMRSALGKKQGEPWREKIPTSLTILQADSIGLKVEKALPCNCEPGVKFDDQLGEMCESNFELNNNQIGQSADKWIEISFNEMDDITFTTIQDFEDANAYPKTYECLGNTFEINDIPESEPSIKLYKRIAEEVSQIEGVEAYPTGENGITFKVNTRLIQTFNFVEVGADPEEKKFSFSTDAETFLKVTSPAAAFGRERILDKDGQLLSDEEYENQAPFSKFLL
ncbi:hypothetical protein K0U91_05585 [Chryseobacterium chendengshani]|uniref:hypothetical protein n=1 Tax=Chryseobacterium sp. LJ668 TaxID=2864040 RepID=UPI001C68F0A3|nr:hypothetical protein [Chryseobacterium sp. LJ668]MBW8521940.1 hypothetical protein [Chryseobacterium sp. LJ668]QYK17596.1 hypothetical protein K0U91_05585 [Chryseobacterium sp. LJ668]